MPIAFTELISSHKNDVKLCDAAAAANRIANTSDLVILDVREAAEHENSSIPGAVNVPRGFLEFRIAEVCAAGDPPILVHCKSGGRAILAAKTLCEMGYTDVTAFGGALEDLISALE